MQATPLARTIRFAENFAPIQKLDELKALVDRLYNGGRAIGFDIETGYSGSDAEGRAVNAYHPDQFIAGFSLTDDTSYARYVPVLHDFATNINPEDAWEVMKPLLEERPTVIHNAQFEAENLRQLDVKGHGPSIDVFASTVHDSMIQAYVLSDIPPMVVSGAIAEGDLVRRFIPEFHRTADDYQKPDIKQFRVGLKSLTKFRYNYDQAEIHTLFARDKDLTAKEKRAIRFNTLPVDHKVVHYACDDAYLCLQLHYDQYGRIMEDPHLPMVYELEMQIAAILVDMRAMGIAVDWDGIDEHRNMFQNFLHEMKIGTREKFEEETGRDLTSLNLNSVKQIGDLIYGPKEEGGMGLTTSRTTSSGNLSTDDKALTHLRKVSPAIDSLLKYRQCAKMGKWFDIWAPLRDEAADERVHPSFIQVQIQSGRFASSNPNIQNLTKRWWFQNVEGSVAEVMRTGRQGEDYWTGNARDFIKASEGYTLLSFDYKSAEIQFLAALAQEDSIIQAFYSGDDFHKWTASIVFGKTIDEVTKKERQAAKAQPLSEPVLTPNGWVPMGEIKPGDFVIGSDGKPTRVLSIQPQGVKKVYRVETSDGSTRCTDEHLWTVRNAISGKGKWKTVELGELMKKSLCDSRGHGKWELPARPVVEFTSQADLPVDPYALGLLLGDGNFTHSWAPSYSSADPELLRFMKNYHESLGGVVEERQRGDENFWTQYLAAQPYESGPRNIMRNPLRLKLRELGLDGKKADVKFVPAQYLTASPEDRLALLQGLMDTDGSVRNSGGTFHNTSLSLCEAVQEIVRSLGGKASIRVRREASPESVGEFASKLKSYDVYLRLPAGINPFRLTRKAEKIKIPTRFGNLRILDVVREEDEECQCILVENEDGLYVTRQYIVTHNTVSFGLVYGQSVSAMAQQLDITTEEAQAIRDLYFARFPNLAKYFEDQHRMVTEEYAVRTWMGRKATLWEAMSDNRAIRSKAERMSVNIPVQGGATGDYTKLAMFRCAQALKQKGWWGKEVRLLMNQHDSLVFEVSNELDLGMVTEFLTPLVQYSLAGWDGFYNKFDTFPPMSVDWEAGYTWGSVADIDERDVLDKSELHVTLTDEAVRDDLVTVLDVIATNPGTAPVTLHWDGVEKQLGTVKVHPDVLHKLTGGDPDIGIMHKPGNHVVANFI